MTRQGFARARANIALAKYWGKSDEALNLPAVPSVSVTLDALVTETTVTLDDTLTADRVTLDGSLRDGPESAKVCSVLDLLRARADTATHARVDSRNLFPSASGLASSASGFAALVGAGARAYGLDLSPTTLSRIARRGSASAARSIHGGFVALAAGVPGDDSLAAQQLRPASWWDLTVVIAVTTRAPKSLGSRTAMLHTSHTSPYDTAWRAVAPRYADAVRAAIEARDLEALGQATEASTFAMHANAWAAVPAVRYFRPVTVALLDRVEDLRRNGTGAWATMDAGPHVKVLCASVDAATVHDALVAVPNVVEVRIAHPGEGIEIG